MGIDATLTVTCKKTIKSTHTFTTDKPWKETKKLMRKGYTILKIFDEYTVVSKIESLIDSPCISYNTSLNLIDASYNKFRNSHEHHMKWCKWSFNESSILNNNEFQSALNVWDDLWKNVLMDNYYSEDSDDDPEDIKLWNKDARPTDNNFLIMIHSKMREILEYAIENNCDSIITEFNLDY
jgi:hypothetical protein